MTEDNQTVEVFSHERDNFLNRLSDFQKILVDAREKTLSPELEEAFAQSIKKVESLRDDIRVGKLKIALVGAFSDGKTSSVAGFLRHADSSMKIADAESSDEVVSYAPENIPANVPPCEFVDTPGLFGQKFSKLTEDYISQAHIILYIVNATNPLKDSHRQTVSWLMHELKKFDNTIFVINRMDDVCDYTDPEDFDQKARTKSQVLRNNVARFCGLEPDDPRVRNLNVVCIASNPGNKGLSDNGNGSQNYWLTPERCEKYETYSRMPTLRRMVGEVLSNTFAEKLIQNSVLTALTEEARENCEKLKSELERLGDAVIPETEHTIETLSADVANAKKDLKREVRPCRDELEALEKKICSVFRSSTRESFAAAVEDELGGGGEETGYKLQGKIIDVLTTHFEDIVSNVSAKFSSDVDVGASNVSSAINNVKKGANAVSAMARGVDKAMVMAGRDLLGKIGIAIKFKPWGATKLAGFASKGVPMIGAGVSLAADVWSMVAEAEAERKLSEAKKQVIAAIQGVFKEVYDVLNLGVTGDKGFYDVLAPQIVEMEKGVENAENRLKAIRDAHKNCGEIIKQLDGFWDGDESSRNKGKHPNGKRGLLSKIFGK